MSAVARPPDSRPSIGVSCDGLNEGSGQRREDEREKLLQTAVLRARRLTAVRHDNDINERSMNKEYKYIK